MTVPAAELAEIRRFAGDIEQSADLDERFDRLDSGPLVALELLMQRYGTMVMESADVATGDDRDSHAANFKPLLGQIRSVVAYLTREGADTLTGDKLALLESATTGLDEDYASTFTTLTPNPRRG